MSSAWDSFIRGFGEAEEEVLRRDHGEPEIFRQLDAVRDECDERGDPRWWPPGKDPENLERLVRQRQERGAR